MATRSLTGEGSYLRQSKTAKTARNSEATLRSAKQWFSSMYTSSTDESDEESQEIKIICLVEEADKISQMASKMSVVADILLNNGWRPAVHTIQMNASLYMEIEYTLSATRQVYLRIRVDENDYLGDICLKVDNMAIDTTSRDKAGADIALAIIKSVEKSRAIDESIASIACEGMNTSLGVVCGYNSFSTKRGPKIKLFSLLESLRIGVSHNFTGDKWSPFRQSIRVFHRDLKRSVSRVAVSELCTSHIPYNAKAMDVFMKLPSAGRFSLAKVSLEPGEKWDNIKDTFHDLLDNMLAFVVDYLSAKYPLWLVTGGSGSAILELSC